MATIKQIEAGVTRYIDAEVAPKIPTNIPYGQVKKIMAVSGAVYAVRHGIQTLASNPALASIGAVSADGNIDVEGLLEIAKEQIPDSGFTITAPILGDLTFHVDDLDTLNQYIREA